jgi:hypothetical protein
MENNETAESKKTMQVKVTLRTPHNIDQKEWQKKIKEALSDFDIVSVSMLYDTW